MMNEMMDQHVTDIAVKQWRKRLTASVSACGRHLNRGYMCNLLHAIIACNLHM